MGGGASPELFIRLPRHLFSCTPGRRFTEQVNLNKVLGYEGATREVSPPITEDFSLTQKRCKYADT
ncbi:MAG: hypothetical protein V1267_07410, partial [Alphaproteobacteria bacterium]|nr:hypothetical protein [Alphaproteobacteria bacterium]